MTTNFNQHHRIMNNEDQPEFATVEVVPGNLVNESPPKSLSDDDLDFDDVQLGQRQKGATQEIVCEGGCE